MDALTKLSSINPTLEDDEPTSLETELANRDKLQTKITEKENWHAQVSNRTLLVLFVIVCVISLTVLLLTLLMLFGKIGRCDCSTEEDSAEQKALKEKVTSLQMGLMKHLHDLVQFNNTLIKFQAGYNDALNKTRSDLKLITDNRTLTSRLEHFDAVLTRVQSAVNRTNTDFTELKSTHNKEKVIYHQTMTPTWLGAHASYIFSNHSSTAQQLMFKAGSVDHASLLKVPMIPANVLSDISMLTVKIVVSNDRRFGEIGDSDIKYGVSDGISFVGFLAKDKPEYQTFAPCVGIEGLNGATLSAMRVFSHSFPKPSDSFYPGQFAITLKLDERESWGSCYTAHDGGFAKTAVYTKRLAFTRGLTLEVYRAEKHEMYGIKFIEVTVVDDL